MPQPVQPNFTVKQDTAAIPGTEYDNLSPEDLAKLINAAHKEKTGRSGQVAPRIYTPPPSNYIDYDAKFGR